MSTFRVGDLSFELRRSGRRKTVGITIERDGSLIVAAPADLSQERVEQIAAGKQAWVYRKLAERRQFGPSPMQRAYVPCESFFYLGRQYRLIMDQEEGAGLRLDGGRFLLPRTDSDQAEALFRRFYTERGLEWLPRRVARLADRIGVEPGDVSVRDLGYRWGSCTLTGINFHWRAMQLPPRIIDYVIAHELVHRIEPHHGPAFWGRLERSMSDYEARKEWLAARGREF